MGKRRVTGRKLVSRGAGIKLENVQMASDGTTDTSLVRLPPTLSV